MIAETALAAAIAPARSDGERDQLPARDAERGELPRPFGGEAGLPRDGLREQHEHREPAGQSEHRERAGLDADHVRELAGCVAACEDGDRPAGGQALDAGSQGLDVRLAPAQAQHDERELHHAAAVRAVERAREEQLRLQVRAAGFGGDPRDHEPQQWAAARGPQGIGVSEVDPPVRLAAHEAQGQRRRPARAGAGGRRAR